MFCCNTTVIAKYWGGGLADDSLFRTFHGSENNQGMIFIGKSVKDNLKKVSVYTYQHYKGFQVILSSNLFTFRFM